MTSLQERMDEVAGDWRDDAASLALAAEQVQDLYVIFRDADGNCGLLIPETAYLYTPLELTTCSQAMYNMNFAVPHVADLLRDAAAVG